MASAEIALVCGLKVRVGSQESLYVNLDADKTLAEWESRYVRKCYITFVKKEKSELILYTFFVRFCPFFTISFSRKRYAFFRPHFL